MVDERRASFEAALRDRLRDAVTDQPRLVAGRNQLTVRASSGRQVVGRLTLHYVSTARGYVLDLDAAEPVELTELRERVRPPYPSRLFSGAAMAMTSSGERWRTFAPTSGGAVLLPRDDADVEATCAWVVSRLTEIFVPRVLDVVDLRPGVVAGVLAEPDHYAYPVLTVVAALRRHGMSRSEVDVERLLGRKVSRDRAFDARLLASVD